MDKTLTEQNDSITIEQNDSVSNEKKPKSTRRKITADQNVDTRPKRKPLHTQSRIGIKNQDPRFKYRVVNDIDDRIDRFKEAGWEIIKGDELKNLSRTQDPSRMDSQAEQHVGSGIKAKYMKIPCELYEEDQRAKQVKIDKYMATIKNQSHNIPSSKTYGDINIDESKS